MDISPQILLSPITINKPSMASMCWLEATEPQTNSVTTENRERPHRDQVPSCSSFDTLEQILRGHSRGRHPLIADTSRAEGARGAGGAGGHPMDTPPTPSTPYTPSSAGPYSGQAQTSSPPVWCSPTPNSGGSSGDQTPVGSVQA
jgi:hypothetical protein